MAREHVNMSKRGSYAMKTRVMVTKTIRRKEESQDQNKVSFKVRA